MAKDPAKPRKNDFVMLHVPPASTTKDVSATLLEDNPHNKGCPAKPSHANVVGDPPKTSASVLVHAMPHHIPSPWNKQPKANYSGTAQLGKQPGPSSKDMHEESCSLRTQTQPVTSVATTDM
jgi:hypothetical protein